MQPLQQRHSIIEEGCDFYYGGTNDLVTVAESFARTCMAVYVIKTARIKVLTNKDVNRSQGGTRRQSFVQLGCRLEFTWFQKSGVETKFKKRAFQCVFHETAIKKFEGGYNERASRTCKLQLNTCCFEHRRLSNTGAELRPKL